MCHPSGPTPGSTPTLTPLKEPARPSSWSGQGNVLFVPAPSAAAGAPTKPRQNLLSGLWSTSTDQGGQEARSVSVPAGPLQGSLFMASGVEAPFYLLFREGGEGQPVLQGIRGNTGFFAGGRALTWGCGSDGDRPVPFHP